MAQDWDTTTAPKPTTAENAQTILNRVITGVEAARTHYYGTDDPSSGASWGADQLGVIWFDSNNEVGGSGDDLGPVPKVWAILDDTPTYGWRTLGVRRYVALEPNQNALDLANQSDVAFTDLDLNSICGDLAIAALLQVTVLDDAPAATVYAAFRKNGITTDARERRVHPQVAAIPVSMQILVELDASQLCEYSIEASGASTFDLRVDVLGYFERAS